MPKEEKLRTYFSKSTKDVAKNKKLHNALAFAKLERSGLAHKNIERRLHICTTDAGENVYIQYPGKESAREGDKARPWDFRPKVESSTGLMCEDLSFKDIWNDIIGISDSDTSILPMLAAVLYRMAFMNDHELVTGEYSFGDFDVVNEKVTEEDTITFSHYRYSPPP